MKPSILVTGAYGGMGKATVKALKDRGFRVFALDKTVGAEEEDVFPIEADIMDENSVKNAFRQACEQANMLPRNDENHLGGASRLYVNSESRDCQGLCGLYKCQ